MRKPIVVLVAALAAVVLTAAPPRAIMLGQTLLMPDPRFISLAGRSVQSLAADFYWLREINVTGGVLVPEEGYAVYQLAKMVADLDETFRVPYWWSAVSMPVRYQGQYAHAKEAELHLRRGLSHFPKDSQMGVVLTHNLVFYQRDYVAAAAFLEEAAKWPDAPVHYGPLAVRLKAMTGQFESARELLGQLRLQGFRGDKTNDELLIEMLEGREQQIELEVVMQRVEKAVSAFKGVNGRLPQGIEELVHAGLLPSVPKDPEGQPIVLDEKGYATTTSAIERLKVYEWAGAEPAKQP